MPFRVFTFTFQRSHYSALFLIAWENYCCWCCYSYCCFLLVACLIKYENDDRVSLKTLLHFAFFYSFLFSKSCKGWCCYIMTSWGWIHRILKRRIVWNWEKREEREKSGKERENSASLRKSGRRSYLSVETELEVSLSLTVSSFLWFAAPLIHCRLFRLPVLLSLSLFSRSFFSVARKRGFLLIAFSLTTRLCSYIRWSEKKRSSRNRVKKLKEKTVRENPPPSSSIHSSFSLIHLLTPVNCWL